MNYGIDMLLKDILDEERCIEVFDRILPGVRNAISSQPMALSLSVRKIAEYGKGLIPDEALEKLDAELQQFNDGSLSPAEQRKLNFYQALYETDKNHVVQKQKTERKTAFYPGRTWSDTAGNRIQAHAGQIFFENDVYYWYGENKEHTDGKNGIWSWGIRCYCSRDLYNWEDLGLIIPPNLTDLNSNLFPDQHLDRPHIVKCDKTGKYVCWIKISGVTACYVILEADSLLGQYHIVKENYQPFGYEVGDFDLHTDSETGKCYLLETGNHDGVFCIELAEDYLSCVKQLSVSYAGLKPPFTREGIAVFTRKDKVYLITSGMSGYLPNQSDAAISGDWNEPFVSVGDPHAGDDTLSSFNSQISQIFQVPGTEKYIALADRWVPGTMLDRQLALQIRRVISGTNAEQPVSEEDYRQVMSIPEMDDTKTNTSISDYVWLPVHFEGDKPVICWTDNWKLSDIM